MNSEIMKHNHQFFYVKQCAHNCSYFNAYILNKIAFIDSFVYAEISSENSVINREITMRIIVDNTFNKLMNSFVQHTNGYSNVACKVAKKKLEINPYAFEITGDTIVGYTFHEGSKN